LASRGLNQVALDGGAIERILQASRPPRDDRNPFLPRDCLAVGTWRPLAALIFKFL
jgi:hypothetical protein